MNTAGVPVSEREAPFGNFTCLPSAVYRHIGVWPHLLLGAGVASCSCLMVRLRKQSGGGCAGAAAYLLTLTDSLCSPLQEEALC